MVLQFALHGQTQQQPPASTSSGADHSTIGGPADRSASPNAFDDLTAKMTGTEELVASLPVNLNKALEYDSVAAVAPEPGVGVLAQLRRLNRRLSRGRLAGHRPYRAVIIHTGSNDALHLTSRRRLSAALNDAISAA